MWLRQPLTFFGLFCFCFPGRWIAANKFPVFAGWDRMIKLWLCKSVTAIMLNDKGIKIVIREERDAKLLYTSHLTAPLKFAALWNLSYILLLTFWLEMQMIIKFVCVVGNGGMIQSFSAHCIMALLKTSFCWSSNFVTMRNICFVIKTLTGQLFSMLPHHHWHLSTIQLTKRGAEHEEWHLGCYLISF